MSKRNKKIIKVCVEVEIEYEEAATKEFINDIVLDGSKAYRTVGANIDYGGYSTEVVDRYVLD